MGTDWVGRQVGCRTRRAVPAARDRWVDPAGARGGSPEARLPSRRQECLSVARRATHRLRDRRLRRPVGDPEGADDRPP